MSLYFCCIEIISTSHIAIPNMLFICLRLFILLPRKFNAKCYAYGIMHCQNHFLRSRHYFCSFCFMSVTSTGCQRLRLENKLKKIFPMAQQHHSLPSIDMSQTKQHWNVSNIETKQHWNVSCKLVIVHWCQSGRASWIKCAPWLQTKSLAAVEVISPIVYTT